MCFPGVFVLFALLLPRDCMHVFVRSLCDPFVRLSAAHLYYGTVCLFGNAHDDVYAPCHSPFTEAVPKIDCVLVLFAFVRFSRVQFEHAMTSRWPADSVLKVTRAV